MRAIALVALVTALELVSTGSSSAATPQYCSSFTTPATARVHFIEVCVDMTTPATHGRVTFNGTITNNDSVTHKMAAYVSAQSTRVGGYYGKKTPWVHPHVQGWNDPYYDNGVNGGGILHHFTLGPHQTLAIHGWYIATRPDLCWTIYGYRWDRGPEAGPFGTRCPSGA